MPKMPKNTYSRLDYISPSKLKLWETDKNLFYQVYIDGIDQYKTKYLELGKRMAETLENGYDEERDPQIEMVSVFMPTYPLKEFKMKWTLEGIPLRGVLDGFNENTLVIGEYKTGKKWSKSMADKSDQLTFYALLCYMNYKELPKRIFLHWAETIEDMEGNLSLSGQIETFETKRVLRDIILLTKRIRLAWAGIQEMKEMINKPE